MAARKASAPATQRDLAAVKAELKCDIAGVKAELKRDIAGVKAELKRDIAGVKSDVAAVRSELKADIAGVRSESKSDFQHLAIEITKTNGRIDDLRRDMSRKIDDGTQRVLTVLDGFVKKVEADNRAMVIHSHVLREHDEKLLDHEKRLASFESKP